MNRSRRFVQAGLFTLAVTSCYALLVWRPVIMTVFGVEPPAGWWFVDTYALLAASDAVGLGLDPSRPNPLDLLHVPHWYSDWWFLLCNLDLTRHDAGWLGAGVVTLFFGSALLTLRLRDGREAAVAWLVLCSPPFMLGVNRANADLLIFAIMALLAWVLAKAPRSGWWLGGPGLVALAAGLKFYPIVAGAALVVAPRPRREIWMGLATMGLLTVLVAWNVADAVRRALPLLIPPVGFFSFGGSGWFALAGLSPTAAQGATWLAGVGLAFGWLRRTPVPPATLTAPEKTTFAVGALLLVGCFFTGVSYSYRLIFILLMLPLLRTWSREERAGGGARPARLVLGLILPLLWIDGIACASLNLGWAQHFGLTMQSVELTAGWLTHTVSWLWVGGITGLLLALYRPAFSALFFGNSTDASLRNAIGSIRTPSISTINDPAENNPTQVAPGPIPRLAAKANLPVTYNLQLLGQSKAKWQRSITLRVFYADVFCAMRRHLVPGRTLEIGSGIGVAREYFPGLVTSDLVATRFVDRAVSAYAIPPEAWGNIIALDVLHHLQEPLRFLASAAAALPSGGRLIMGEPAATMGGRFFYGILHHEPCQPERIRPPFVFPAAADGGFANMGMAQALFGRACPAFEAHLRQIGFKVVLVAYRDLLAYPASGGFSRPALLPAPLLRGLLKLERLLPQFVLRVVALRMIVVLQRE